MSFEDFMTKIRHIDNLFARWMLKHFYILFFELVLVIIFFLFFFSNLQLFDLAGQVNPKNVSEELLLKQATNSSLIIFLLLLNSFWMLFIFSGINRLRVVLKEINYNLIRQKHSHHPPKPHQ